MTKNDVELNLMNGIGSVQVICTSHFIWDGQHQKKIIDYTELKYNSYIIIFITKGTKNKIECKLELMCENLTETWWYISS